MDNSVKRWLQRVNRQLQGNNAQQFVPHPDNLKLHRNHGILKNFLRLTNKTLIGLNTVHLNPWQWAVGLLGIAMGWACSQTDDFLLEVINTHQKVIKQALIDHVLRSAAIKDKLNEALLHNVYTHPPIQYSLHQLLLTHAILPQEQQLQSLTKQALIALLHSPQLQHQLAAQTAQLMAANSSTISKLAHEFLRGGTMEGIVSSALGSLLRGETVSQLVASEIRHQFNGNLMRDSNKEHLYLMLRQHFINW